MTIGAGAPPAVRTVAAFDFDGTLSNRDTLVPFLMRVRGRRPVLGALAARGPRLARGAFDDHARRQAKESLLIATVGGLRVEELEPFARQYAEHLLATQLRPDRVARLRWHQEQGHDTVIVSASPELYLEPLGALLGCTAVIATKLEVDREGQLTGRIFQSNVRGPVKVELLSAWLAATAGDPAETQRIYAYGDSDGDAEMLAMSDVPTRLRSREKLTAAPEPR